MSLHIRKHFPLIKKLLIFSLSLFLLVGCSTDTRLSVFNKCVTLGDESIAYARANYVKLFHHFNPKRFSESFQKVKDFDSITHRNNSNNYDSTTHRNIINNYDIAVRKLKTKDDITKNLVSACKELAIFSKNLVDQTYPRAISHKSKKDPLSNDFFNEINNIVYFDHAIGSFDKNIKSFKQYVSTYQQAVAQYKETYHTELSSN